MSGHTALELDRVSGWYGRAQVLTDASFTVAEGEVVALIGRNGAGKTSLLRALMGLMPRSTGRVMLNGTDVARLPPFRRAQQGLGYVPEDRRIFTDLTVAENLRLAARSSERGFSERDLLDRLERPVRELGVRLFTV